MQNLEGRLVDLYIPRKCSATNNLIGASDHASIQVDIAKVDKSTGIMMPDAVHSYVFCGEVRAQGETDDSLNRLATQDGILKNVYEKN
ncbi:40S ribosomal protein S21 [Salpingoeca rosetta]|uniref:40S ribosomal protein S21 n=1 Tax=Salpingoeca rosetta (strain ATCC 50818 / BSB-021) TaxID=946362 RepID=F2UBF1_SALR5|nr:40S ribosomal protein S21 [Salpingoeca rosetta]EGD73817.1 40S ribosomal protein S21 [Salpingoeca rosetta]|eukprot:XP_004993380.1 40S ribosomal protein S21 [Salpingoeca rosetta]